MRMMIRTLSTSNNSRLSAAFYFAARKRAFLGPSTRRIRRYASKTTTTTTTTGRTSASHSNHAASITKVVPGAVAAEEEQQLVMATGDATRRSSYNWKIAASSLAATAIVSTYVSLQVRKERIRRLDDNFCCPVLTNELWDIYYPHRSLDDVMSIIQRAGLMGKYPSVKSELDDIRSWHTSHGYKGGLVVRDLTQPLFGGQVVEDTRKTTTADEAASAGWTLEGLLTDPMRLARRECYYLYYEITPNGKNTQQIFCRGTTLLVDVLTLFQLWMVYDPDLGEDFPKVHKGFRDTANRILDDVLPLLSPPNDQRSEIEIVGHSLGGSVAGILAAKLKKRGYNVTKLTTIAEPAYIFISSGGGSNNKAGRSNHHHRLLQDVLPKDHIRIEDDRDFVPFLPPFGHHVGNKIWLTSDGKERLVIFNNDNEQQRDTNNTEWTDSIWYNFQLPEILASRGKPHRIPNYLKRLEACLDKN